MVIRVSRASSRGQIEEEVSSEDERQQTPASLLSVPITAVERGLIKERREGEAP